MRIFIYISLYKQFSVLLKLEYGYYKITDEWSVLVHQNLETTKLFL